MIEIGETEGPIGPVKWYVDKGSLVLITENRAYKNIENELYDQNGEVFLPSSVFRLFRGGPDIAVPDEVLDAFEQEKAKFEYERHFEKIGWDTSPLGRFDYYLQDTGNLVCRTGDYSCTSETLLDINFKKVIPAPCFGSAKYLEVPPPIAERFLEEKDNRSTRKVKLIYVGKFPLNGKEYFRLSAHLPSDAWGTVMKYFEFMGENSGSCKLGKFEGWLTSNPVAVERTLGITGERTLSARMSELTTERAKFDKLSKEINSKLVLISKAFENAEYPDPLEETPEEAEKYQAGFEKITLEGETVPHPYYPDAECWIINEKWIYSLQKNSGTYDDWTQSNVLVDGTSCIAWRVPYSTELAGLVRSLA